MKYENQMYILLGIQSVSTTIKQNSDVKAVYTTSLTLEKGFSVEKGSTFEAKVAEGCP
ncbi:MAG: hypothetical protein LIO93_10115 [Bacteroidales bacterium]|nr:hypothetical protein [Bacteroidales bacterium]